MIPSNYNEDFTSSYAEKEIFKYFKENSPNDWIVLHSYNIAKNERKKQTEIDFLLLAPHLGIFALEVKGGSISRINGDWKSNNKEIKNPFEQVKYGLHQVIDKLKERELADFLFGHGVMFPNIDFPVKGCEAVQWQIYDKRYGANIQKYINVLYQNYSREYPRRKIFEKRDADEILQELRGNFDIPVSILVTISNTIKKIDEMTIEQFDIIDQLEENPRIFINGSAGTGKTFLAKEIAARSCASERIGLFCYNSNLGQWYAKHEDKKNDNSYFGHLHRFMFDHIKNCGVELLTPDGKNFFEESDKANKEGNEYPLNLLGKHHFWEDKICDSMLKALDISHVAFDRLIIDEYQDLLLPSYLKVFDKLLVNGLKNGNWCMLGDYAQQSVHNKLDSELNRNIELYTEHFTRSKLTKNCRNTKQISECIFSITKLGSKKIVDTDLEGKDVDFTPWKDLDEQKIKLENKIKKLLEEKVKPDDIIILSINRNIANSVISKVSFDIRKYTNVADGKIRYSSISKFKGLESPVIIIVDVDNYEDKIRLYQGMSRASSYLIIFESTEAKKVRLQG